MLAAPRVFGPHLRHIIPVRATTTNAKAARSHRPVRDCETTGMAVSRKASQMSFRDVTANAGVAEVTHSVRLLSSPEKLTLGMRKGDGEGNRLFEWDCLSCVWCFAMSDGFLS